MSRRTPSLARRAFPALALTAVGVGMVQGLDRPSSIGAVGALDANNTAPSAAGNPAITGPNGSVSAAQTPVVTVAPATGSASGNSAAAGATVQTNPPAAAPVTQAPAAPVTAAPVTVAPATGGTCGEITGVGAEQAITWRRSYGVISVTAKFTAGGDLCDASAQWQAYDSKSQRYEEYAVPILNQQAEAADSANIQGVSGATAVVNAYRASLQSAIDNKK